jgi:hypothetical protein
MTTLSPGEAHTGRPDTRASAMSLPGRRAKLARGRVYQMPQDAPKKRTKPGLQPKPKKLSTVKREVE